ncbi:MAG: hypothetical protein CME65_00760 [Halobacteriovoraceae bacterium]|nr:hypothetical protein [Halobacteriovoraceae bacterium]|tara:strand:+ start:921 stop:2204 length:1284 start_codon:yes stop_codon:yes gene_type:complete
MRITLIGFVLLLGSTVAAVWMKSKNSNEDIAAKSAKQVPVQNPTVKDSTNHSTDKNSISEVSKIEETPEKKELKTSNKKAPKKSAIDNVAAAILPSAQASDEPVEKTQSKTSEKKQEIMPDDSKATVVAPKKLEKKNTDKPSEKASDEEVVAAGDEVDKEISDEVSTSDAAPQLTGNLANLTGGGKGKKLTGNVEFGASTDLKPFTDQTKASLSSLFIRPRYQLTRNYALQGTLWFDKGLTGGQENLVRDTRVGIAKTPTKLLKGLLLAPNITATLPTSEFSRRNQRLNAGIEFNPTLIYQPNSLTTVFYTPRMRVNLHEYTTTETDRVNTQYQFTQLLGVSYSLSNKWTVTPILLFTDRWSYEGTQIDPTYLTILEMRYQLDRKKYISFGTLTGGSLYDAQVGPDQNIEIFDENSTSIYANIGILF